jgi:hypothetical protein
MRGKTGQPTQHEFAISTRFRAGEPGMSVYEMDLKAGFEEDDSGDAVGAVGLDPTGGGRSPIENPAIDPIPDDPLLEPHPGEPGVHSDGTAAPLENPDDSVSADPLAARR